MFRIRSEADGDKISRDRPDRFYLRKILPIFVTITEFVIYPYINQE